MSVYRENHTIMGTIEYAGQPLVAMPENRIVKPVEGEQYPLFVYGASKSGFTSHRMIAPYLCKSGEPAVQTGAIMLVNARFPFILCVGGENDNIMGELVTFTPETYAVALVRSDSANGIYNEIDPANFTRHLTTVWTFDRKPRTAWVYVAGPKLLDTFGETPIIPTGWWTAETMAEAWAIFNGNTEGDVVTVKQIEAPAALPALSATGAFIDIEI